MMTFNLRGMAEKNQDSEYVFGYRETKSHACYMIYGILKPREKGRMIKPGKGHEEIVLAVQGDIAVSGAFSFNLPEGSAFHATGEDEFFLENPGTSMAVYIVAGGHSDKQHH